MDINILNNGTILGHATAKDIVVTPGPNYNITVDAVWDPLTASGKIGKKVGKELLSQYLSGTVAALMFRGLRLIVHRV